MELQIFNNPEFGAIRTVEIDGEIYFVGKDVATALGYINTNDALALHVDAEDKKILQRSENATFEIPNRGLTVINESGLYSLILSSKLPQAKEFKRWVTTDVLPKIRKYGVYATADFAKEAIKNPKWAIDILKALQTEQAENARLTQENTVLNQQVAELTPKASYYDVVLNCKDLVSVSKIAKDYGMSATEMNKLLNKLGVQYKQSEVWLLYQKYAKLGWTSTKTITYPDSEGFIHSKVHTYWTQAGRLGLYHLLKENGYLPRIEQN